MGIQSIEESKKLRVAGERLGRAGMSERVLALLREFHEKYPEGNYKEAIILAGRLHAISLASHCDPYWWEQSNKGYQAEIYDLADYARELEKQEAGDET